LYILYIAAKRNVGLDNLEKLAKAFEIRVSDLLSPGPDWRL